MAALAVVAGLAGLGGLAGLAGSAGPSGLAGTASASPATQPPVVGGKPADITRSPWVTQLTGQHGEQLCGGTLVRPDKVVTAAHCMQDQSTKDMRAVTGRLRTTDHDGTEAGVSAIWTDPAYRDPFHGHDVAVLTLDRQMPETPLALAEEGDAALYRPGAQATVYGWGSTTEGGPASTVLREATVPLRHDQDCSHDYGNQFASGAMVCAGRPQGGVDSCQGDSGGPLAADGKLLGVVSFGDGCARPDKPGVYARISTYSAELRDQLGS